MNCIELVSQVHCTTIYDVKCFNRMEFSNTEILGSSFLLASAGIAAYARHPPFWYIVLIIANRIYGFSYK